MMSPGQDAYEVFSEALEEDLSAELLSSLTDEHYIRIASVCAAHLEHSRVTVDHVRAAVRQTLEHWR